MGQDVRDVDDSCRRPRTFKQKNGGIGSIMQTPNYPENVAEKNSPESLVVRFAEPVGTEADSCDSHKLSVSELSKRIHVECPCFLSRTKAVRNRNHSFCAIVRSVALSSGSL
jgi:hypothetical protein